MIVIPSTACPTSIEAFARCYLSADLICDIPPFHREMYQIAEDGHKRIVICAPRSFAKSTVFSKIYPLYQILEGDASRILIVSATGTLAEHWLREIKRELEENPFILEHYGDVSTKKWTQDNIFCQRADGSVCEVLAKGAGYQIRGFRPDIVIVDDIETDEGVRSEDQRDKLRDWFNKALINTLEKDSQLVMIGTMLHPLSLLNDVMNREGWVTRKYQAISPDNKSLWPQKWPMEALLARKAEIGTLAFNSEFQNEPLISENPIFVKEWFRKYEAASEAFRLISNPGLYTVCAVDPAISKKESADYTAICTISATFGAETKYYVRPGGVTRGHWTLNQTVHEGIEIYDKFQAKDLIVETVAYQEALADEYRRFCEERRRFVTLTEIKPDKDKERRAHAVAPLLERGQVYFDYSDPMTLKLIEELMVFPTGDRDDLVDVFVFCLTKLKEWASRLQDDATGPQIVLPDGWGPNRHTGMG